MVLGKPFALKRIFSQPEQHKRAKVEIKTCLSTAVSKTGSFPVQKLFMKLPVPVGRQLTSLLLVSQCRSVE